MVMNKRFKDWKQPLFDKEGWAYKGEIIKTYYGSSELMDTKYGWRCQHPKNLKLGNGVDIGCFTYMNAKNGITIGENTQIGSHCSIYSYDSEREINAEVVVGKDCLIGAHCVILPGSILKDNMKIPIFTKVYVKNGKTVVSRW